MRRARGYYGGARCKIYEKWLCKRIKPIASRGGAFTLNYIAVAASLRKENINPVPASTEIPLVLKTRTRKSAKCENIFSQVYTKIIFI